MKYNNINDPDIFSKLPKKRQERLKERAHMSDDDMEIEIDMNEIIIVKETDESILAMVPCQTTDLYNNMYIEYFFETEHVELRHLRKPRGFLGSLCFIFRTLFSDYVDDGHCTTVDIYGVEQIIDYLKAISEDIYAKHQ